MTRLLFQFNRDYIFTTVTSTSTMSDTLRQIGYRLVKVVNE